MAKQFYQMEFKSIIKAHDSNPWRFIHPKPNYHWQYQKPNSHWQHQSPILIGNIKTQFPLVTWKLNSHWQHESSILIGDIKAQFSLATSKPNFCWRHQSPIFIGNTLSKRKEPKIINAWQRKKYCVKMLSWQKRTMAIILWRNSLRAILRIMFLYYKPVKYMDIICITTSIIYVINTHGKHSNSQTHHLS